MSACNASVIPIPIACPFTAAMTGVLSSNAAGCTGDAEKSGLRGAANVSAAAEIWAPLQNAGGAPVSTMTRTAGSSSSR
ncbi:Uncharacterised protein [Mycobacteroides abscessus]|nr:Uncharacterised protein [Mycobacteroides abscessus]